MGSAQNGHLIIIGSGLAGYGLAREFRKRDAQTPVTIITADGGEAYTKPMLSNALSQNKTDSDLVQKSPEQVQSELSVQIRTRANVTEIDRAAKMVTVNGQKESYDRLVLAMGADPRPTGLGDTVATVNDLDDFRVWRQKLAQPSRILLIGAGLVGCEFANDLTSAGHQVILVDPAPWPLGRLLPEPVGQALASALTGIGVSLHLGASVAELGDGKAVLKDGAVIEFDHALSAIGLIPRTALAKEAGLLVDKGIVVDGWLRSSDPSIYALGDCAQSPAGLLPFVMPLMIEARTLADVLTGTETPLRLPAMPVVVKTPCLPLAVCPPAPGAAGTWGVEGEGRDLKALFVSPDGIELGFALSGKRAAERQALAKSMPTVLD